MPNRTPAALAVATALLAAACGGAGAATTTEVPLPPVADPAGGPPAGPGADAGAPSELTLTIPVGTLPDGSTVEVVVRSVEAGGRRRVATETPAGVVDQHVMTDDEHWWWIPPMARGSVIDAEWIHLDVREVERAGGRLPRLVASARLPLPAIGELAPGDEIAGWEVRSIERTGPDEERLHVVDLEEPVVLRRRSLPARTTVELPAGATPLRELPEALRW